MKGVTHEVEAEGMSARVPGGGRGEPYWMQR
jgi:hypothetical protein